MSAAKLAVPSTANAVDWIGGSRHHLLLTGADTAGASTVIRSTMRAGAASPVHVHPGEDETIALLSGSAVVWIGEQVFELVAGEVLFMPRGVVHAYRFTSDAEMLTFCAPSGMEEFFRRAGWPAEQGDPPEGWSPSMAALRDAATAGGQVVLGPPLTPGDAMPQAALDAAGRT